MDKINRILGVLEKLIDRIEKLERTQTKIMRKLIDEEEK